MDLETLLEKLRGIEPYVYLATPYARFAGGIEAAHLAACRLAGWLICQGVRVFSPIAHSHAIALAAAIDPCENGFWIPADRPLMRAAGALVIGMLPG